MGINYTEHGFPLMALLIAEPKLLPKSRTVVALLTNAFNRAGVTFPPLILTNSCLFNSFILPPITT